MHIKYIHELCSLLDHIPSYLPCNPYREMFSRCFHVRGLHGEDQLGSYIMDFCERVDGEHEEKGREGVNLVSPTVVPYWGAYHTYDI
jgi:hypothetical protein